MHGNIRVIVNHIQKFLPDCHCNAKLLPAFPCQCDLAALACLQFAADKFPEQSPLFLRRTLTDQKFSVLPDECACYLDHNAILRFFGIVYHRIREKATPEKPPTWPVFARYPYIPYFRRIRVSFSANGLRNQNKNSTFDTAYRIVCGMAVTRAAR